MCRRQNFCKDALSLPSLFRSWVGSEMFRIYFKNAKGVPRKQANTVLRYVKVKKRSSYAAKRMKALTTSWFFAPKYASVINVILLAVRFLLDAVCLAKLPGLFHLPVEHGGTWWNQRLLAELLLPFESSISSISIYVIHFWRFDSPWPVQVPKEMARGLTDLKMSADSSQQPVKEYERIKIPSSHNSNNSMTVSHRERGRWSNNLHPNWWFTPTKMKTW